MDTKINKFIGALLVAASVSCVSASMAADKLEVLTVSHGFQYGPLLVAKELGYYTEEGIDLTITRVSGGARAMAAIASGSSQIALTTPQSAFRGRAQGVDFSVFGADFIQLGSNFVISGDWARKHKLTASSPYAEKLAAMRGMTVGVAGFGSGADQIVRYLADEAKLKPESDLTITAMGNAEAMMAAMAAGRIDGFLQSSPVSEEAINRLGAVMFINVSAGEIKSLNGFLYIAHVARQSWLEKNNDLAVRFVKATEKALKAIHDPVLKDKARDSVRTAYHPNVDKSTFDVAWANQLSAFPKSQRLEVGMIKQVSDFVNKFEEPIKQEAIDAAWTNAIVEKAVK